MRNYDRDERRIRLCNDDIATTEKLEERKPRGGVEAQVIERATG
jgi:hypothetical protein